MKRRDKKIKKNPITDKPMIRVRLDERTIILVKKLSSLELWKEKYPDLKIISK